MCQPGREPSLKLFCAKSSYLRGQHGGGLAFCPTCPSPGLQRQHSSQALIWGFWFHCFISHSSPSPGHPPPAQAVGSVWGLTQPQSPAWDVQIQPELTMTSQPISPGRAGTFGGGRDREHSAGSQEP